MEGHFSFSDELIAEITAYYRERCGVLLSPEKAEQYLNSLADLYQVMEQSVRDGLPSHLPRREGGVPAAGGGGTPPEPSDSSET